MTQRVDVDRFGSHVYPQLRTGQAHAGPVKQLREELVFAGQALRGGGVKMHRRDRMGLEYLGRLLHGSRHASVAMCLCVCLGASLAQTATSTPASTGASVVDRAPLGASAKKKSRSIENIKDVVQANGKAIYSIYAKLLDEKPTSQGALVLQVRIAPSGKVEACEVLKGEGLPVEFADAVIAAVKKFDFGEMDVEPMVVNYPIKFQPR